MSMNRSLKLFTLVAVLAAALAVSGARSTAVLAGEPAQRSVEDVYWWWDPDTPIGTSRLLRTGSGISAELTTSGLPAGHAMTLWWIVFNHPENCMTPYECALPFDLFTEGAGGDFLFASGNVTGGSGQASFAGYLSKGDTSDSWNDFIGLAPVGLTDPDNAHVYLAVHSHGPKLTGQALAEQISTFDGGCQVFLNPPTGFAAGPQHVPANVGECATIQAALHAP